MPIALDEVDVALIKALIEDGRCSYRQLARMAKVSPPTAEERVKKMMGLGFIKRISPIFDVGKVEQSTSAIVCLKVDPTTINEFSSYLSSLDEVRNVFLTTGECNVMVRITCPSNEQLQAILDTKICNHRGVGLVNSYVVTRTIKDEQGVPLQPYIRIRVACDYCGEEIKGTPFVLKVGNVSAYLCCKTCLSSYKEKYRTRIANLEKASRLNK